MIIYIFFSIYLTLVRQLKKVTHRSIVDRNVCVNKVVSTEFGLVLKKICDRLLLK